MTAPTATGRYNPDDPSLRYATSLRHAALAAAAAGVRVRRGSRVPVEQVLLAAAAILFPLGLVLILLGWYGAAHTGRLYAQIDYLISGGLLGLGISVAGGFMYFGYWLSRQLTETRRQNSLSLQSLQRIEDLLEAAAAGVPGSVGAAPGAAYRRAAPLAAAPVASAPHVGAPRGAAPAAPAERARPVSRARVASRPAGAGTDPADATGEMPATTGPVLLATPRGSLLHRPQCPVVAKRTDVRSVPAGAEGFGYCTMCDAAGALA